MVYAVHRPVSLGRRSVRCGDRERTLRFHTIAVCPSLSDNGLRFGTARDSTLRFGTLRFLCVPVKRLRFGTVRDRVLRFVFSPFGGCSAG